MSLAVIPLRDAAGRPLRLELVIRQEYVECMIGERCYAVFDRDALRNWLAQPAGLLSCEQITWIRTERDDIAISIDGVVARWPLTEAALTDLRHKI